MTYEVIAHWICCDGTKTGTGIVLQTQSFTVKECVFLINILMHKFNLKCNIYTQRKLPVIYISGVSMRELQPKIIPFIPSAMRYKLHSYKYFKNK